MLVDGNNLVSRADFAAKGKQVAMSHDGVSTASLVIFVNLISKYVRLIQPTHLAVMWDAGHDLRDAVYPAYKANRVHHEEGSDDTPHFSLAKEFLTWAGVPHKAHRGFEADDLIAATVWDYTTNHQWPEAYVAIVSGDKDLLQLCQSGSTQVVQYRVPDDEPWTAERYYEAYGYATSEAAMVHALVGDTSDNVPGLKGIGIKKAVKMLEEAGWDWTTMLGKIGPEKAAEAVTMRRLVDLRDDRYCEYPGWFLAANEGCPAWDPTQLGTGLISSLELEKFLDRHALKSIRERLEAGTLWVDPENAKPTEAEVFEGI
jgi:5'-3' exonuclease